MARMIAWPTTFAERRESQRHAGRRRRAVADAGRRAELSRPQSVHLQHGGRRLFSAINLSIFGDEHSCLWAKGKRRLIAFKGGWVDITEPTKATVITESGLGTFQSCVYNSRLKKWIRVVSHQMPLTPGTPQYPRGKYHRGISPRSRSTIRAFAASRPTT